MQSKNAKILDQLYAGNKVSLMVYLIIGVVYTYSTDFSFKGWGLVWGVLFLITQAYRVFRNILQIGIDKDVHYLLTEFRIHIFLCGVLWGGLGSVLFPFDDYENQLFVVFIIAGLSGGAIGSLIADRISFMLFVVPAILPLCITMLFWDFSYGVPMGTIIFLYLLGVIGLQRRSNQIVGQLFGKEEDVERLKGELEVTLDEKKKAVEANSLLEDEKNVAEKALQFKTEFLAQMSHEIRTPLNGIIGSLETLDKAENASTINQLHSIMKESSFDLLHIVNNVLKLSKLEAQQEKLELSPINLMELCGAVVRLYQSKALEKGTKLNFSLEEGLPKRVLIDGARVRQILNNLVSNALKFTEEGKVDLIVESCYVNNQFGLCFKVKDTGEGISKDQLEKIFSKYGQGDDQKYKRESGQIRGTGLGLTISNLLVNLMQGEAIKVESEKGKGSMFYFSIPYDLVTEAPIKEVSSVKSSSFDKLDKSLSILLVEDIKANQIVAKLLLESLGCKVEIAENGEEAVLKYQSISDFDIVLMDIQMPVMYGLTATLELKKLYGDTLKPIIGLSANAMEGDAEKYMSYGMNDYIPKPITKENILKTLSKFVVTN